MLEELLCVNAPQVPEVIAKIKLLLANKATFVFFRNKPFLLFHGKQEIGWEGSNIKEKLVCLYRMPQWINGILVFKC